jgi:hypothetical protein
MATHSTARICDLGNLCQPYHFAAEGEPEDGGEDVAYDGPGSAAHDDLPYKVELWNAAKNSVEQVLAVTANASIGYAAYYAATREHPDRYVTLRHKDSFVSRWNGPTN